MGILKRAGDLIYTFRFLTLLATPFEKTKAYELGLIDKDGNRIKDNKVNTTDEKSAYTPFHRLVFNLKKLLGKIPGGKSSVASYAAALYLIKEHGNLTDKGLKQIIEKTGHESIDFLNESSQWFLLESGAVSPGVYRLKYDKMVNNTFENIVKAKDQIRVEKECYPIGDIFGLNIYEGTHLKTNQKIYFTVEELMG
jgi:hypothetical protein